MPKTWFLLTIFQAILLSFALAALEGGLNLHSTRAPEHPLVFRRCACHESREILDQLRDALCCALLPLSGDPGLRGGGPDLSNTNARKTKTSEDAGDKKRGLATSEALGNDSKISVSYKTKA